MEESKWLNSFYKTSVKLKVSSDDGDWYELSFLTWDKECYTLSGMCSVFEYKTSTGARDFYIEFPKQCTTACYFLLIMCSVVQQHVFFYTMSRTFTNDILKVQNTESVAEI